MSSVFPFVINLVNTAFGVTVLAVPYCFHQCGVILGTLLLVASSYASKKSCSLLLRSAQISRKRDFESLGFHVGGFLGKFIVEMSLIGYLVGTAIAWFVIIGDVSPAVVSSLLGIEKTWWLRSFLIVAIGVCIVLPLSLVKDITSLSSASNVAIGIYTIFVLQESVLLVYSYHIIRSLASFSLLFSTLPRILSGDWVNEVNIWKPDGVLQCLPIFGISFLCQTVVFVLYEALPEPSVKKMEHVVNTAMDIVLLLSFTVGFSGYVRYYDDGIEGDLLNNYKHDFISEFIRLGFCISTILSFPLLVFPCRSSINSLISSAGIDLTPAGGTYIPHDRFFVITCSLIVGTLICGVLFPSVEFVMALVGATMGALLTFILPSGIFLKVSGEDTSKTGAKVLLVAGICLFCLSTFSVLSISESQTKVVKMVPADQHVQPMLNPPTLKPNTTLVKSTEELKKARELVNKIEQSNKSVLHGGERHDEETRSIIDEQKILVPQRNTAEIVKESRKEPALPQEGIIRQLHDGDHAKKNPRQHADIKLPSEVESKSQPDLVDTKRRSEGTQIKRQPEDPGLLRHQLANAGLNPGEDQRLRRLPGRGALKPRDDILKEEDKNARSEEKDRALNDEVRIAGERKILNDGTDIPSDHDVKTITVKPQKNTSLAAEKEITTQNIRTRTIAGVQGETKLSKEIIKPDDNTPTNTKTIANAENLQKETKPSSRNIKEDSSLSNGSEARKKSIKSFRRIQSPLLLRKQLEQSRIKLIERNRRKQPSDDRES